MGEVSEGGGQRRDGRRTPCEQRFGGGAVAIGMQEARVILN